MKRVVSGIVVVILICIHIYPISAKENLQTPIYNQKDLIQWYESDSPSCLFMNDIMMDEYYEFYQTKNSKIINTQNHSLIIQYSVSFLNSNLEIIGTGMYQPVIQMAGQDCYATEIYNLQVEATLGDALLIRGQQKLNVYASLNRDFPIKLKAKKYALIIEKNDEEWFEFHTTQFLSEQMNAIFVDDDTSLSLEYCEINHQQELKNMNLEYCYINTQWTDTDWEFDYEEVDPIQYVENMSDFEPSLLPTLEIEYEDIDLDWDLSHFDVHKDENRITAKILMNPLFLKYLNITEIEIIVKKIKPVPLNDFSIGDLMDMHLGTYRPYFEVTFPIQNKVVYLDVYRSEDLLYRRYDITEDINSYYWSGSKVYFMTPRFSEISANEIYYCQLVVEGGPYAGTSNFIKLHNGIVENINPFLPPDNSHAGDNNPEDNTNDSEIVVKPDATDPDDTMGGNDGHRGDSNRDETAHQEEQVIMTSDQIAALEKTQDDFVVTVGNFQTTASHDQIEKWKQTQEDITLELNEYQQMTYQVGDNEKEILTKQPAVLSVQTQKKKNLFWWIGIPIIFIGISLLYRRKKHGK